MVSVYTNHLRLEEIGTGEQSGDWGTTTNTNLELIAEAFSYGTEAIADADITLTMADGTSDGLRSFYVKITSSVNLTATRTITLAPNDLSKVWMIENATSGSQIITIKQGTGATVNIANGQVKMVATDGGEADAIVYDLLTDVELAGTTTATALTVDDVAIDGKVITMTGSSGDTATMTVGTNGTLAVTTTDGSAAAANITITADGTFEAAGTTVTLNSSGGITLDADGGTITFADDGASLGTITSSGYSGTAAVATTVTITDNESTNENNAIIFTAGGDVDGGNIGLESDGDLTYNPSTGTVTATGFSGNLTGTLQTAAQGNVTSLGTLTALTVDQVAIDGAVIGHTSDTDLITLSSGVVAVAGEITGTGFTGTLDGILGSGTAAAATVTTLDTSGAVNLNLTTDSSSSTSGALIVDGGVGIAKKLYVGTDFDVSNNAVIDGTALVTGVLTTTATQVATGGITSGSNIVSDADSTDDLGTTSVRWANLYVDAITATDQITATGFTGTLDGILGSGSAAAATVTTLDTSGAVNLNLTTDSTSSTSGALIVDGGVGVAKKLFVGTDLDVDGTTNLDAVDIDGAVNISATTTIATNNKIQFRDTDIHISSTADGDLSIAANDEIDITSTLIDINGAADVSGNLGVGGNLTLTGNLVVNGTTTTVDSANLAVEDPLIKLGQGGVATTNDQGFIFTRGDGSSSNTANRGFIFDESTDQFAVINCNTEDGTTSGNVTINDYANLHVGGLTVDDDLDVDGTLEADAITVDGTALATVIAGTTVTNATNSAHVLVTDNESTNEENLIAFVEGATSSTGNVGLEMDGNFAYNPSTGTVTATVFKGNIDAVDGDFDGTLEADAITIGGTAVGSIFSPIAGGTGILTTGALDTGSITSGFGTINNGASAITTTGVGTFGSLDISGDIDVDGTTNLDVVDIDGAVDMATTLAVAGNVDFNGDLDVDGTANLDNTDIDGTLDVSGQVTIADGSAGAPALSNTGDTNTGLLFSAADTMAFSAGGTSQFTMADGAINPVTDNDVDLGTASLKYKNVFAGLVDAENFKINGAQGSDGQVLTSTGSGVAFETISVPAGGSQDFVATGSISDGNIVGLKSDGTVSVVEAIAGSITAFTTASAQDCHAVFDSNSNKVVIIYQDVDAGNDGKAVVGTVSGNSISFGSIAAFSGTDGVAHIEAAFDSNSNKVVIAFSATGADSNDGYAIVGTVSGTSISFGTAVEFANSNVTRIGICFVPDGNRVVIGYRDEGDSNKGKAIVGTVSGTGISFGTAVEFEAGGTLYAKLIYDTNADRVVIAYRDQGDSNKGKAIVGTVSGTGISFGTPAVFLDSIVTLIAITFDSNSNKVVIGFKDSNTGTLNGVATPENAGFAIVGTVSGTGISFGSPSRLEDTAASSSTEIGNIAIGFDSNANKIVCCYTDTSNGELGKFQIGTVSGTSIAFSGAIVFQGDQVGQFGSQGTTLAFDANSNRAVIPFRHDSGSNVGKCVVINTSSTLAEWIGFADGAISDGATGAINVVGGINDAQSSLTIGTKLFLQNDATISTTVVQGREVGRAVSATKILITKGSLG